MAPGKATCNISAFSNHFLKLTPWDLMSIPTAQTQQVPPLPNPNSTLQMQVRYIWATATSTLCCVTGFTNLAYTAAETRLGAGIPQASEMVLETMKKRHMWWPLPDKLLLGLEAAGVANCFHLLCYEISILPSPRLGKYWPFNILLRLGWASLKTVTIKSAHWKIPNVCW